MIITLAQVRRALAQPRPGRMAQARLLPEPRPGDLLPPPPAHPDKEAAVLILLYVARGELYFVLTRRTQSVAMHKGQISLPGGAREAGEALADTALRETAEELHIDARCIELLGAPLTPLYIPVSQFWVTAFVGHWRGTPQFTPAPDEVHEVIETPLALLLDDSTVGAEEWTLRGVRTQVPFFDVYGNKVWGATAMILSEFKALLVPQAVGT